MKLMFTSVLLLSLVALVGCGGSMSPSQTGQFSLFGYTWEKHASAAPGGGTFSKSNVAIQNGQMVLTLNEDSTTSDGAEVATVTPFSYGTYTFTYYQDVVESGSIASGFSYGTSSVTEISVEQQGQCPNRWDFTNWQTTAAKQTSFVNGYDATKPHTIKYVWRPGRIQWFIDGQQVANHDQNIPSASAPFLFNFWGTNKTTWVRSTARSPQALNVFGPSRRWRARAALG